MRTNLKYLLIVSLLFLVACQPAETVSFQYELTEQHPWVSFDVFTENHHDGVVNWRLHQHAIIHYAGDESLVFMESYDVEIPNRISYAFMLNKKEYVEIDHDNLEIMQYANK